MALGSVYGHERQMELLRRAVLSRRISHAYLFHGIEGIGKRTAARAFAKALNCRQMEADSCDRCESCVKFDHGHHPDVVTVAPEGQFIRIKEVREMQGQMRFRPLEGTFRIFIVSEADRLNGPAANALLKTLEEPARNNVLILSSSRPHHLLPTVLSRCQRLKFDPLPERTVASYLVKEHGVEEREALLLAASSAGSIGRALELSRGAYVAFKNQVIDGLAGIKDPLDFFSFLEDFEADREDILKRLDILFTWYRDILYYRESGEDTRLIHRDRLERIKENAAVLSGPDLLEKMGAINRTRQAIEQNANRQLALEWMMFRLFRSTLKKENENRRPLRRTTG